MAKSALMFATCCTAMALAGCGGDLDSRNEAALEGMPEQGQMTVETQPRSASNASRSPNAQPTSIGFDEDGEEAESEEEEPLYIDAEPESLIDDTQGFAAEPLDDTSGFDPTPTADQAFGVDEFGD